MRMGPADDSAATTLRASDKPVLIAPAMNAMMWANAATQANLATLASRGVLQVGPGAGELACGEVGFGRMAEPAEILAAIAGVLVRAQRLAGRRGPGTRGASPGPREPVGDLSHPLSRQPGRT